MGCCERFVIDGDARRQRKGDTTHLPFASLELTLLFNSYPIYFTHSDPYMNCTSTQQCPFLYQCLQSQCLHDPIFPIKIYPMLVYLLLPLVAVVCNLGGLSIGAFKIILFMDMLNYPVSEATNYAYVAITGASLANLLNLVNKRHPKQESSLVDYQVVILLVPGLLLGTNLGVMVRTQLYDIIQDGVTLVTLSFFGVVYLRKFLQMRKDMQAEATKGSIARSSSSNPSDLSPAAYLLPSEHIQNSSEMVSFWKYKKSYHIKDILICFFIFGLLQALAVLTQGKFLLDFRTCSPIFWAAQGMFVLIVTASIFGAYKWVTLELRRYKTFGFDYDVSLHKGSTVSILIGGSLLAGLCQGVMGIGSGYVIILCMLHIGVTPQVTAASSGFIIFFVGLASLIQVIVLGQIEWQEALLLFGITFVGSFVGTILARRALKGKKFADLVIMLILSSICFASIAGIAVNVGIQSHYFGFSSLISSHPFCE